MQIWIAEVEYYQKLSSHTQIGPQGAEKQLGKVGVRWWVVCGQTKVIAMVPWCFFITEAVAAYPTI